MACMPRGRTERTISTWMALLAILLVSLAPVVAHAVGSGSRASWSEVCSAQGSKWIQIDAASPLELPAAVDASEHCALCLVNAHGLGLSPQPQGAILAQSGHGHDFPIAFLAVPRTPHAWVTAQPRAPPLVS
jgi:hypothetical protein